MHDSCDILIVDDQPGVRRLLEEMLSEEGHRVMTAASGTRALELMFRLKPRVIVLDMKMPGLDGLGTLKQLRERGSQVPVVIMTAFGELETGENLENYGVKHYIIKPFDLDEVRSIIKQTLEYTTEPGNLQKIGR